MIYSMTDKLKFEDNPQLEIKGRLFTVKSDAKTVLKLMDVVQNEGEVEASIKATEMLFSESDQKALDEMNLSMADYQEVLSAAMSLAVGADPDEDSTEE